METISRIGPSAAPFWALVPLLMLAIEVLWPGDFGRSAVVGSLHARTNESGSVEVTYSQLSDRLSTSQRTLHRHIAPLLTAGILLRPDPLHPFRYRWNAPAIVEAARRHPEFATAVQRFEQISKDQFSSHRTLRSGVGEFTAEQREACATFYPVWKRVTGDALRKHRRAYRFAPLPGPFEGFDELEKAQLVGQWVYSVALETHAEQEDVAEHLAHVYVADSLRLDETGKGKAWENGCPVDWIKPIILNRAAATFRGGRRSPAPGSIAKLPERSGGDRAVGLNEASPFMAALMRATGGASC